MSRSLTIARCLLMTVLLLTACAPQTPAPTIDRDPQTVTPTPQPSPTPTPTPEPTPSPEQLLEQTINPQILETLRSQGVEIYTSQNQIPEDSHSYLLFNPETRKITLTFQHLVGVETEGENVGQAIYEQTSVEVDPAAFVMNKGFQEQTTDAYHNDPRGQIDLSEEDVSEEEFELSQLNQVTYTETTEFVPVPLSIHPPLAFDEEGNRINIVAFQDKDSNPYFVNPLTGEIHRLSDYRPSSLDGGENVSDFGDNAPLIPLSAFNDGAAHFAFFLNYPELATMTMPVYDNRSFHPIDNPLQPLDRVVPVLYNPSDWGFFTTIIEFYNHQDTSSRNYRTANLHLAATEGGWESVPVIQYNLPFAFKTINPATGAELLVLPQVFFDPQDRTEGQPISFENPQDFKILWTAVDWSKKTGISTDSGRRNLIYDLLPRNFERYHRESGRFATLLYPIVFADEGFYQARFSNVAVGTYFRGISSGPFGPFAGLEGLLEVKGNNPMEEIQTFAEDYDMVVNGPYGWIGGIPYPHPMSSQIQQIVYPSYLMVMNNIPVPDTSIPSKPTPTPTP